MYYPQSGNLAPTQPSGGNNLARSLAKKSSQLRADYSILTDLVYAWNKIPHRNGNAGVGVNALFGDMHATFSNTKQAFTSSYWDMGTGADGTNPGNNTARFCDMISLLRP